MLKQIPDTQGRKGWLLVALGLLWTGIGIVNCYGAVTDQTPLMDERALGFGILGIFLFYFLPGAILLLRGKALIGQKRGPNK